MRIFGLLILALLGAPLFVSSPAHAQSCSGTPNANTICAGPSSGGSGFPNFRNMVTGDIQAGIVTGSTIASGTITGSNIASATVAASNLVAGAAASNVGTLGGDLSGTLPNPTFNLGNAHTWTGVQNFTAAGTSTSLIGQGASTTVTMLAQPASPVTGRAYAIVGQAQGNGTGGQKVGVYGAADNTGLNADDVWGGNFLAQWDVATDVNVQSVEIDMNNLQSDTFSLVKNGLTVSSGGTHLGGEGIRIASTSAANKWKIGLNIFGTGVQTGIAVGQPTAALVGDAVFKQIANAGDTLLLQRNTDSSPTGQLIRAVNAANGANLFIWDVAGNLTTIGEIIGGGSGLVGVAMSLQNSAGTCTHTPGAASETVSCSSDVRLKEDIRPAASALDWIDSFDVKDFTLRSDPGKITRTGLIAQEVQRRHPEMVHTDEQGMLSVEQPDPWKLLKAMQELKAEIRELKAASR